MDENTDRTPIINVINESSSFDADDDESTGYDGYVTPDELITNYSQPNLLSRSSFQRQSQTSSSSKLSDHPPFDSARMQYGSEQDFRTRLQNYFLENQKSSLRIRSFHFFIKVLSCVLYCVRVVNDNGRIPESVNKPHYGPEDVKYAYLIWVDRSFYLWACQVIVAVISMIENVVIFYLSYKGSAFRVLLNINFLLELLTSAPLVVTIFKPEWRELYVPIFLNCWLAMNALQEILSDLNRVSQVGQSALFRQMIVLFSVLICLIFTGACGMEHLQRAGQRHFDLFTSLYFVMVTFSTVGYGDLYPDTWMSRLYVISLICIAFGILPSQVRHCSQILAVHRNATN
ncbi:hypothetical protein AB6A40_001262 [Gnathostoma spinigerum]|uniref:Potassium channel domain-containing protein n=1 Tax=Gnathostoma spinigerum TaxID=75299 RepID=A0ABD6E3X7_9BILA